MKINVGDYAYSKKSRDYGIGKIVKIHTNGFYHEEVEVQYKDIKISTRYEYVISSPNPIDLIQVGDYVNGWRVNRVEREEDGTLLTVGTLTSFVSRNEKEPYLTQDYNEADKICKIKSIVTKEQFESMEYNLESEVN